MWTEFGINKLYPNLFVFLVGPPGVGKSQAINPMTVMLRKSQAVALAPDDMTKQGLLDVLQESGRGVILNGRPFDYHYLTICGSELANFMSKYDLDLTGILTHLFDCPPANEEKKRGHDKGKLIPSPGISLIMGTATENLGATISSEMWGSGFMARVIMVFAAEEVIPEDMFAKVARNEPLADELTTALRRMKDLIGPMEWTPDAQRALLRFRRNQKEGAPVHARLTFYITRRWLHLAKLVMIAALSEERLEVTEADFHMGLSWLLSAEAEMPEIFKDMMTHEDGAIYEDLRQFVFMLHSKGGQRRPIHASVLYDFLKSRAATYAVPKILEIAEAAYVIQRVAGTTGTEALYVPGNMGGRPPPGVL